MPGEVYPLQLQKDHPPQVSRNKEVFKKWFNSINLIIFSPKKRGEEKKKNEEEKMT
ncbi:Protein of unknown function [Gryllus bimaculatus]|nr:Protein of unknown function [Gryllus bimaculatus]